MAEREREREREEEGGGGWSFPGRNGQKRGVHISSPIFDLMSMIIWWRC